MLNIKITKKIIMVVSIIVVVASLACVLFPTVSNTITQTNIKHDIEFFDKRAEGVVDLDGLTHDEAIELGMLDNEGYLLDEQGNRDCEFPVILKADLEKLLKDSMAYNEVLKTEQGEKLTNNSAYSGTALTLSNYGIYDGIYGYVSAPSIDLKLPIYLGANEYNMSTRVKAVETFCVVSTVFDFAHKPRQIGCVGFAS